MRYFMMLDEKKEYAEEVTKELQEQNEELKVQTRELYTVILSMCREMKLGQAETVRRLETQASMTHEDAVEFVASVWE